MNLEQNSKLGDKLHTWKGVPNIIHRAQLSPSTKILRSVYIILIIKFKSRGWRLCASG